MVDAFLKVSFSLHLHKTFLSLGVAFKVRDHRCKLNSFLEGEVKLRFVVRVDVAKSNPDVSVLIMLTIVLRVLALCCLLNTLELIDWKLMVVVNETLRIAKQLKYICLLVLLEV